MALLPGGGRYYEWDRATTRLLEQNTMHQNRIATHLAPIGQASSLSSTTGESNSAFPFCLIGCSMGYWQHALYRAAYEMALAANQPSPLERALAVSVN